MLSEATQIDEYLTGLAPDVSDQYWPIVDRAELASYIARCEIDEHLDNYVTQPDLPRYAAVALLAAAVAHGNARTSTEDEVLTHATSNVLERFLADCKVVTIRDWVEDLLNLSNRLAALAEIPAPRETSSVHNG